MATFGFVFDISGNELETDSDRKAAENIIKAENLEVCYG